MSETKQEEVVKNCYDHGKTDPPSAKEVAARKDMERDQAKYEEMFWQMTHPEGKDKKEIDKNVKASYEKLTLIKKKLVISVNRFERLRSLRR